MPNANPAAKDIDEDIERRLDQLVAMVPEVRRADYAEGWNACLDAAKKWVLSFRVKLDDADQKTDLELIWLAEKLETLRK